MGLTISHLYSSAACTVRPPLFFCAMMLLHSETVHSIHLSTLSAKEKDSGERIKPAAPCGGREKSPVDFPSGLLTLLRIITIAQYFFLCNKPLGKPSSKPPSKPVSKPSRKTLSANTHKHWIPAYPALEKMSSGAGKTFSKKIFYFNSASLPCHFSPGFRKKHPFLSAPSSCICRSWYGRHRTFRKAPASPSLPPPCPL